MTSLQVQEEIRIETPFQETPQAFATSKKERIQRYSWVLGIAQVTCGVLAVLLGIVGLIVTQHVHHITLAHLGSGIWCGVFFIFSGVLSTSRRWTSNLSMFFYAYVIMSIVSFAMAATLEMISIIGAISQEYCFIDGHCNWGPLTFHASMGVIGLIAGISSMAPVRPWLVY